MNPITGVIGNQAISDNRRRIGKIDPSLETELHGRIRNDRTGKGHIERSSIAATIHNLTVIQDGAGITAAEEELIPVTWRRCLLIRGEDNMFLGRTVCN